MTRNSEVQASPLGIPPGDQIKETWGDDDPMGINRGNSAVGPPSLGKSRQFGHGRRESPNIYQPSKRPLVQARHERDRRAGRNPIGRGPNMVQFSERNFAGSATKPSSKWFDPPGRIFSEATGEPITTPPSRS